MSILASLTSGAGAHGGHISTRAEIEAIFHKIMSPIKKEADPNLVAQMCSKVNADFDGAQIALDLITSKLHSNQEWEVLIALYVLEACVKNCGDRFHDLIGRFRFLNEMIKLVSPKYFGNRSSEKVKKRCIELLYCWSDGLPSKTKIREAYDMLKKQGLVTFDPSYVEKLVINVQPRQKNVIFDNEEKSRQLAQLLKSKNPQDLEAANRLIKNMVRQDEIKIEKQSNRINELELVNNNIKLLNDMLLNFNRKSSTESERETIKYLYEELQKLRPNLVKLANETEDNDESIGEIIKTNEQCEKIINQYKLTFLNERAAHHQDDKLVNINEEFDSSLETISSSSGTAINTDQSDKSTAKYDPLKELQDLFSHEPAAALPSSMQSNAAIKNDFSMFLSNDLTHSQQPQLYNDSATKGIENLLSSINVSNPANSQSKQPNQANFVDPMKKTSGAAKTPQLRALEDLNELGRNLIEKSLNDPKTPLTAAVNSPSLVGSQTNPSNLTLNDLQQIKSSSTLQTSTAANIQSKYVDENAVFNSLNSLFVELESIKPGNVPPFTLYDKNNLKIVLHFGRDQPASDINVIVISATSSNTQSALKNFSFQAAVPKSMKIKLQPSSRSDLPVHNPILAPSVITQVMLVANPKKEQIRLKYKISYAYDDVACNEMEEVKTLPILDSLI